MARINLLNPQDIVGAKTNFLTSDGIQDASTVVCMARIGSIIRLGLADQDDFLEIGGVLGSVGELFIDQLHGFEIARLSPGHEFRDLVYSVDCVESTIRIHMLKHEIHITF